MEFNAKCDEFTTPQEMNGSSNDDTMQSESVEIICEVDRTQEEEKKKRKKAIVKTILTIILCIVLFYIITSVARCLSNKIEDASFQIVNRVIDGKMSNIVNNLNRIQFQQQAEEL